MKTKTLNHTKALMFFFGAILYSEYKNSFDKLFKFLLMNLDVRLYEVTFSNPKSLYLDNKVSEPVFMALDDVIINSWNFKNEKFLKGVNWNGKLFYYCEKQYDVTFYHIIGSSSLLKDFERVYNFKSWSYKKNMTKKERSFIYKFKNGYFKNKYSWNLLYWEELQDSIKVIESQIMELEVVSELVGLTSEEMEELQDLEQKLKFKKDFEDKLLFSVSEATTTLRDYEMEE